MCSALDLLVVDDDAGELLVLRTLFDELQLHHRCHCVSGGRIALDFLKRNPPYEDAPRPHLILLDLNMPEMSGCDVLSQIKGDPDLRSIPTIIFSSSRSLQDVSDCYQRFANAYVRKPLDLEGTRAILRDLDRFWSHVLVAG
jgi:CheY-like chemotaxis protein